MKRVNFKRLAIKNFLSIGKNAVVIDFKKGLHVITGENKDKEDRKNGVGKSVIADAFYFAIFGDTIRNINKDKIVNNVTGGTVHVELDFDVINAGQQDHYKIIRQLNNSKLFFYRNDQDITLDSIANTTRAILEVISATPQLFLNCLVMTLNDTQPFLSKSKADTRKFIEDIFNLEYFSKMLAAVKVDFTECRKNIEIKKVQVGEIERNVNFIKEQLKKKQTALVERKKLYEERLKANIERREQLEREIESYGVIDVTSKEESRRQIISAVKMCNLKITDLRTKKSAASASNKMYSDTIARYSSEEGNCPVCARPITSHTLDSIEAEKRAIKEKITANISAIAKVDKNIELIEEKIASLEDKQMDLERLIRQDQQKQSELKSKQRELQQLIVWLKELDKDLDSIESADNEFEGKLEAEQGRFDSELEKLTALRDEMKVIDAAKFILGDDGVKSVIIKNLISLLNSKLIEYSKKLDGNAIFTFNEFFEPTIVNRKNKVCDYYNFSGAERRAIDLSCLFSFADIKQLQGGVSYNVSIYDELFDSALDETGVGLVLDILHDRINKNDECVYIISHRKEAIKSVTGDVIYLVKENDITKRVDYSG